MRGGYKRMVRHWRRTLLALAGLLAVGAVFGINRLAANPSVGSVSPSKSAVISPAPAANAETAKASGKYVSFAYPDSFSITPADKPSGTVLESFSFVNRDLLPPASLYVSVLQLPNGRLADEASYHYRLLNPSKYQPETWMIGGAAVPLMFDLGGGFNKTAFVTHAELVAEVTIACAGASDSDSLNNTLRSVLTNLKWL